MTQKRYFVSYIQKFRLDYSFFKKCGLELIFPSSVLLFEKRTRSLSVTGNGNSGALTIIKNLAQVNNRSWTGMGPVIFRVPLATLLTQSARLGNTCESGWGLLMGEYRLRGGAKGQSTMIWNIGEFDYQIPQYRKYKQNHSKPPQDQQSYMPQELKSNKTNLTNNKKFSVIMWSKELFGSQQRI